MATSVTSLRGGSGRADSRRMCVYCGFDGLTIQAGGDLTDFRCPACSGDLYSRPPRSYLEMEGFVAVPAAGPAPVTGWRGLVVCLMRAWNRLILWRRGNADDLAHDQGAQSPLVRAPRVHDQRGTRRRMTGLRDEGAN